MPISRPVSTIISNPDGADICAVPKDDTKPEGGTSDVPLWNNPQLEPENTDGGGKPTYWIDLNQTQCAAAFTVYEGIRHKSQPLGGYE